MPLSCPSFVLNLVSGILENFHNFVRYFYRLSWCLGYSAECWRISGFSHLAFCVVTPGGPLGVSWISIFASVLVLRSFRVSRFLGNLWFQLTSFLGEYGFSLTQSNPGHVFFSLFFLIFHARMGTEVNVMEHMIADPSFLPYNTFDMEIIK